MAVMIQAEFTCICGFTFKETLREGEITRTEDFERFYVRCPRCGEEAALRSWGSIAKKVEGRKAGIS